MSATTAARAADRSAGVVLGGVPHAFLLPPEIAAQAQARRQRRGLAAVVVLVVIVVILAYVGATAVQGSADRDLLLAQNQTTDLLAEQTKYGQVSALQAKSSAIQVDQQQVTLLEIDWQAYLKALQRTLPQKAQIQSVSAKTSGNPVTGGNGSSTSPLDAGSVAQVTLTATTTDVPDVVTWINGLSVLPGYAGATPTSVTKADGGGYQATFVISVNQDALEKRFAQGATK